jgi:hypothetical protein
MVWAVLDDVDVCFFAALELADNTVDQSLGDELLERVAGTRGNGASCRWGGLFARWGIGVGWYQRTPGFAAP